MSSTTNTPPTTAELISLRCRLYQALRQDLHAHGCDEVSTPILCPHPDVAPVRQFVTTHPHRGDVACLRIAPTEFLKRLLADGVERVFEFSTNFRGDLPDATHLPEFVSLEVMARALRCRDMEDWTERICKTGIRALRAPTSSGRYWPPGRDKEIDLDRPWLRVSVRELLADKYSFSADDFFDKQAVQRLHGRLGGHQTQDCTATAMDDVVTAACSGYDVPVFVGGYPRYLGGPAEPCTDDPRFKERSELFLGTLELANMSSTLVDPVALRSWHEAGVIAKDRLGVRPNTVDTVLLATVDRGIPASAVLGIGIDRLLMVALALHEVSAVRPFPYGTLFSIGDLST